MGEYRAFVYEGTEAKSITTHPCRLRAEGVDLKVNAGARTYPGGEMRSGRRVFAMVATVAFCSLLGGCSASGGGAELCEESANSRLMIDPTNRPIAFTSDRSGSFDLWLMDSDGSDSTRLTASDNDEVMPSWSPDGTQVAFASAVNQESPSDICVINSDGSGLKNLTQTADVAELAPSWSPDGEQIVYGLWTDGADRIHIIDSDGGESRMLAGNGQWPSWSPDGERILFSRDRGPSGPELWTMKRDGSGQKALTDSDAEPTEPSWSPDGSAIAFVAASGDADASDPVKWNEDIFVIPAGGGTARRMTTSAGNDHWPPAWSPDGEQLVYTADGTENVGRIVLIDLNTREITSLTDGSAHDMFPAWRR